MRAVEVPVDYENLETGKVPLRDGRLRLTRQSPPSVRQTAPEEPRPAVETRLGHDLRGVRTVTLVLGGGGCPGTWTVRWCRTAVEHNWTASWP